MKNKFKVGDKVVTTQDERPYYSGYAGNPVVLIPKGSIGYIGAIDVPCVRGKGTFNCVDFIVPDKYNGNPALKNDKWRCSIKSENLKSASLKLSKNPE